MSNLSLSIIVAGVIASLMITFGGLFAVKHPNQAFVLFQGLITWAKDIFKKPAPRAQPNPANNGNSAGTGKLKERDRPRASNTQLLLFFGLIIILLLAGIVLMFNSHAWKGGGLIFLGSLLFCGCFHLIQDPNFGIYTFWGDAIYTLRAGPHLHWPFICRIKDIPGDEETTEVTLDATTASGARINGIRALIRWRVDMKDADRLVRYHPDKFRKDLKDTMDSNIATEVGKRNFLTDKGKKKAIVACQEQIEKAAKAAIAAKLQAEQSGDYRILSCDIVFPTMNAETDAAETKMRGFAEADVREKMSRADVAGPKELLKEVAQATDKDKPWSAAGAAAAAYAFQGKTAAQPNATPNNSGGGGAATNPTNKPQPNDNPESFSAMLKRRAKAAFDAAWN